MNELNWMQHWYQQHCDGKWEHQHGIKIDTLDNPGWHIEIDGLIASVPLSPKQHTEQDSETSWIKCSLENGKFQGYGDPQSLEKILRVFRTWIESEAL
jgi:hypothetical protein